MEIGVTITLVTKTCEHGHIYALPSWVPAHLYLCPMCAGTRFSEQRREQEARLKRLGFAQSHITRLKNQLKAARELGQRQRGLDLASAHIAELEKKARAKAK